MPGWSPVLAGVTGEPMIFYSKSFFCCYGPNVPARNSHVDALKPAAS